MGIARLLDEQKPGNTHGIYRTMFSSLREQLPCKVVYYDRLSRIVIVDEPNAP